MSYRKISSLILIAGSLLTGCGKSGDIPLLCNSDFILYQTMSENHLFYTPSFEEFNNLYNSNLNYIIFFTEPGCSACQSFDPIIKEYIQNSHQFVVKVDGEDKYKIQNEYKEKFFPDSGILTPSIFIKENGDNFYNVNYSKYMQTYNAFSRHMESRYKTSKCAYFCGQIQEKSPVISEYSQISFISNDTFKNKLSSKLMNTEKNVVISTDFDYNSMTLFEKDLNDEFAIVRTIPITDELDDETIAKYL